MNVTYLPVFDATGTYCITCLAMNETDTALSNEVEVTVTVPTGVLGLSESVMYAFPNPVSDILMIDGVDENQLVTLFDMAGEQVLSSTGSRVDVAALPAGLYILKVNNQTISVIIK